MTIAQLPLRIAQISDIHCGDPSFQDDVMKSAIDTIKRPPPASGRAHGRPASWLPR